MRICTVYHFGPCSVKPYLANDANSPRLHTWVFQHCQSVDGLGRWLSRHSTKTYKDQIVRVPKLLVPVQDLETFTPELSTYSRKWHHNSTWQCLPGPTTLHIYHPSRQFMFPLHDPSHSFCGAKAVILNSARSWLSAAKQRLFEVSSCNWAHGRWSSSAAMCMLLCQIWQWNAHPIGSSLPKHVHEMWSI